jgi:hypothetical protein
MMKSIKLLGLLVAAALTAMALAGAGSASAAVFCLNDTGGGECSAGQIYPYPVGMQFHSTSFTLKSGALEVSCESPNLSINAESKNGESGATGQVTAWAIQSCKHNCASAEAINLPYKAEIQATESGNGTLKMSSSGKGEPGIKFLGCEFAGQKFYCTYGASEIPFAFNGGNPATLSASKAVLKKIEPSGSACATSYELSANYSMTAQEYFRTAGGISTSTIKGGAFTVSCNSSLEGAGDSTSGAITKLTFSSCSGKCETSLAERLPWSARLEGGVVAVSSGGSGTPRFRLSGCEVLGFKNLTCYYEGKNLSFEVSGGELVANETLTRSTEGSQLCPNESTWTAKYPVTTGTLSGLWLVKG